MSRTLLRASVNDTQMKTENCFRRSGDGKYLENYQWECIDHVVKDHLKYIRTESNLMLLNLLRGLLNVKGQSNCAYEPLHIKIKRIAFVASIALQLMEILHWEVISMSRTQED